jgi:uncharacterized membrane protein YkvA (DUF1232 family)
MMEQGRAGVRSLISGFRSELAVYRRAVQDTRTPWAAKLLLGAAIAYVLSPIDLIPDFIPVLGHLDDLVVVPLLVWLALRLIPGSVLRDAREFVRDGGEGNQRVASDEAGSRIVRSTSTVSGHRCHEQETRRCN